MTRNELEELTNFLAGSPDVIRRLAIGLSDKETRWKPADGMFSVVENVCHLRDIEQDGYALRIQKILSEDQPFLPDLDGAKLAEERNYNSQELNAALDAFAQAREANVSLLRGLTPEKLTRTGTFENTGTVTLEKLLEMMREHDDAHMNELTNLRGKIAKPA